MQVPSALAQHWRAQIGFPQHESLQLFESFKNSPAKLDV
jgi:hypothetical protein